MIIVDIVTSNLNPIDYHFFRERSSIRWSLTYPFTSHARFLSPFPIICSFDLTAQVRIKSWLSTIWMAAPFPSASVDHYLSNVGPSMVLPLTALCCVILPSVLLSYFSSSNALDKCALLVCRSNSVVARVHSNEGAGARNPRPSWYNYFTQIFSLFFH